MTHEPAAIRAFVGLGSNLDDPLRHVVQAFRDLQSSAGISELCRSRVYRSAPMGPQDQADFYNAVAVFATTLRAAELLDVLQEIETRHGRQRGTERWGPRTLDLDLLLYGAQVIDDERLVVPHSGLYERAFVLYPLSDVAPELRFPNGRLLRDLLGQVPQAQLHVVDEV